MKNKTLSLVVFALIALVGVGAVVTLILAFGIGSFFTITSSSGQQPTPVIETAPASQYQPVIVDQVEVEVGVGSPILVEIVASGTWPDLCAQIASVETNINEFNIDITVLASSVENCHPDNLGLPFRFAIPLNIVEMEAGTYTITVNGTSNTLDLPLAR